MVLPFLDRAEEKRRLRALLSRPQPSLGVVYGRRRCGKTRLLREVMPRRLGVYVLGDERETPLQVAAAAAQIARLVPGFDRVVYPGWDALFERWIREAPPGAALALDEFPYLVAGDSSLPSVIQKHWDLHRERGPHLILCGSSQQMMQNLTLSRGTPLYGRADEIICLRPLRAGWLPIALDLRSPTEAVEWYAAWGGIPRYWELAAERGSLNDALRELVFDPRGPLHDEPLALLREDLRDPAQAASILELIGAGCHRPSEIAARLGKPATDLARPLQRLLEMELVRREVPFNEPERGGKRVLYRLADPFLRLWFGTVQPRRSELQRRAPAEHPGVPATALRRLAAETWEDLSRESAATLTVAGSRWRRPARWWGGGRDKRPLEIDLVAESEDGRRLLLGEASWERAPDLRRMRDELERKAATFPLAEGRDVILSLWLREPARVPRAYVLTARQVVRSLRW